MKTSSSKERVLKAFRFERPDRIPRFDHFWNNSDEWIERFGPLKGLSDIAVLIPDETPFPSRVRTVEEDTDYTISVNGWGQMIRTIPGSYFYEVLEVAIPEGSYFDKLEFDSPSLDDRFTSKSGININGLNEKEKYCCFTKTGGPFLRTSFMRGEEQFLMDMAGDPKLAKAITDKVTDHITAVGIESMRRWNLFDTGVWIYDDMASNHGPMFSSDTFEKVFLPAYRRMIKSYKEAGAAYVILHSDGNIMPILDMLVDAGIDGLNPLEQRAGMDIYEIRKRHPKLIMTGGMCNTETLLNGPVAKVEKEARELIDLGRDGGVVIGTHSIGPEIPMELFAAYHETCLTYGDFS